MDRPPATIAVVIATYNYGRFIVDAIESALAQQPAFDEVIVVDDGSTDGTADILKRYEDRALLINCSNGGQVAACLTGMRAATTDYVYLLDADDYLAPGMVAAVKPLLASRPAKVQFQLEGVDASGAPLDSVFPAYPDEYTTEHMLHDNRTLGFYQCPPTSGNVFDRQLMLDAGLDPAANPKHIDAVGALIQPYLGEVVTLPERLAFYRVHGGNMFNTSWNRPTVAQLQKELREFHDSWAETMRVLGLAEPPFGDLTPAFVRERELMIAALENRVWCIPQAISVIRQLLTTQLPRHSKFLLAVWAMGLAAPIAAFRRKLIYQRRNPQHRSRLVRTVIGRRAPRAPLADSLGHAKQNSSPRVALH